MLRPILNIEMEIFVNVHCFVLVKKKKNKRRTIISKKKILYIFEKITIKSVRVFCVFEVLINDFIFVVQINFLKSIEN